MRFGFGQRPPINAPREEVMNASEIIAQCFDVLDKGGDIAGLIAAGEREAGHVVVRPGEARWLPIGDWNPGTVCSITKERTARLVLLHARKPNTGAFTLLVYGLTLAGLSPAVIDPTREFGAALSRRNWRCKTFNRGDRGQEHVWRPREGLHAIKTNTNP